MTFQEFIFWFFAAVLVFAALRVITARNPVHAALFLRPGGRMALVLPAELLSVNYAAAVRKFLFLKKEAAAAPPD